MITALRPPCEGAVVLSGERAEGCTRVRQRWTLVATILGSSMVFIDGSVVNLALPKIQENLGANAAAAEWVVEIYTLALSSLILVGGALGDHYGRRRIFAIGTGLFAAASVVCGLAGTIDALVAARAAQGIGGALLVPGCLAMITAFFDGDARAHAFGTWSGVTSITALAGPALGGWLIGVLGWRAVFFINVPFALVTLWIAFRRIPESRPGGDRRPLDGPGATLATAGLLALVYGLIDSQAAGLGVRAAAALAAAAVCLGAFAVVERRSRDPMVPFDLFRSRTFSGTNLLTLLLYAAVGGVMFYLPFAFIQVHGYSTFQTGWALVPFVLPIFVVSRSSERLVRRFGPRRLLILGPLICAAGFAGLGIAGVGASYWLTFLPACAVTGIGMGMTVAPLTNTVMGSVPTDRSGVASGINNAVARAAGLIAIAVFGIVRAPSLADGEGPEAYVAGFRVVVLCAAGLAVASALVAAWLIGRQGRFVTATSST